MAQDLLDLEPDQRRDMLNLHARFLQKLEDNRNRRRDLCVGLQQVCTHASLQSVWHPCSNSLKVVDATAGHTVIQHSIICDALRPGKAGVGREGAGGGVGFDS